jgi:hypothetical protein
LDGVLTHSAETLIWLGASPLAAKTDLHQMGNCILQAHQAFVHVENNAVDMERKMTFQQGVSGNPHGNRHRTRHLLNQEFMQALLLNFRHQGKKAIEKVARNQPAAYLKILALLVPRELKVEQSQGVKAMSDEQLERSIELIKELIAKRDGENAKVIEGVAAPAKVGRRGPRRRVLVPRLASRERSAPARAGERRGGEGGLFWKPWRVTGGYAQSVQ